MTAESEREPPRPAHSDSGGAQSPLSSGTDLNDARAKNSIRVLIVDDERTLRESSASILEAEGYAVAVCAKGDEASETLKRARHDVALIDLYMADVPGIELVREGLRANPALVPIVMTGNPSVSSSFEALRAGAWDYLPKPFSATQLQLLVARAAHAVLEDRRNDEHRLGLEQTHGHSEKLTVLGLSPAFRKTIELARTVAPTDASVFIMGESGTGKELIAQFIHHHSRRSAKPIVAVNCAALPETLLESEMFGHCKGAFTGAVRDKPGLLEIADGGTMFLDEILDMELSIQAKLLRVIQDGVVRRVGSTKTDAVVNVRFIAATNQDAGRATESGRFREDLFYRLGVVPIRVPSLRERPDDIPILAEHFLARFWRRHRERGAPIPELSDEAVQALKARPWPGNVRELENAIEHAVVFLRAGEEIQPEDIPSLDVGVSAHGAASYGFQSNETPYHVAREAVLEDFEKSYLQWVISRAGGNIMKAARIAGVDRTTIYRLMQKRGLHRKVITVDAEDTANSD